MSHPESSNPNNCTFFEFLKNNKMFFSSQLVENFLLSIKVKPFVILSGGTGTGKTKLAQMYGKYISEKKKPTIAETEVTLTKADTNNGFTLSADDFFKSLPYNGRKADGTYKIKIGDLETECTINMSPRLWYRPNVKPVKDEINKLKSQGKEKETLQIFIPTEDYSGKQYEIVPVGSNWTESRFIVGYKNVLTQQYSPTKALNLIIESNNHQTMAFLLVLDEMNLSHVERYFSEILSAMESEEPISLDSDGSTIPESISIGENLVIIGTVNVDETTYAFSPKVLDRANVIEFESTPISGIYSPKNTELEPDGDLEFLDNCMKGIDVRKMNFIDIIDEICKVPENKKYCDRMISDLDSIKKSMDTIHLSFGYRTIDEIFRFMYASWIYKRNGEFSTWSRFFDAQIKQKILPKIHGNLSIRDELSTMFNLCKDRGYETSAEKIDKMIKTLEKQRYVSFNN